jgi:hypothetical protein
LLVKLHKVNTTISCQIHFDKPDDIKYLNIICCLIYSVIQQICCTVRQHFDHNVMSFNFVGIICCKTTFWTYCSMLSINIMEIICCKTTFGKNIRPDNIFNMICWHTTFLNSILDINFPNSPFISRSFVPIQIYSVLDSSPYFLLTSSSRIFVQIYSVLGFSRLFLSRFTVF